MEGLRTKPSIDIRMTLERVHLPETVSFTGIL